MRSSTASVLSGWLVPMTDGELPSQAILFVGSVRSRCRRSETRRTDSKQAKLLTNNVGPDFARSGTGAAVSRCEKLCDGSTRPEAAMSDINSGTSSLPLLEVDVALSVRQQLRMDVVDSGFRESGTSTAGPDLEADRSDRIGSRCKRSSTGTADAGLAVLRAEAATPRWARSGKRGGEPMRNAEEAGNPEPKRV